MVNPGAMALHLNVPQPTSFAILFVKTYYPALDLQNIACPQLPEHSSTSFILIMDPVSLFGISAATRLCNIEHRFQVYTDHKVPTFLFILINKCLWVIPAFHKNVNSPNHFTIWSITL